MKWAACRTRNFSTGRNEEAGNISGEMLHELCTKRGGATGHPCSRGCAIRCSNVFHDEEGNYVTSGLEYETIGLLGSNCGLNNLDEIAKLDRLCDDLGIDTMEMGATLGVTMEAGIIPFGSYALMKDAIESVVCDILGVCIFVGPLPENMPVMTSLLTSFRDQNATAEDLLAMANNILSLEARFNELKK